ncbi:MAG: phenylalanine--tRNA ligase beta subunit-related protein [Desulfobacterales bacterium]|jgi:DNA/RNA-binding domain of Phe-tRNA-synthetase-like protein
MYFCHSPEIKKQFPQIVSGGMMVDTIHPDVDVEPYLKPWYRKARSRLKGQTESQMPEIIAWRKAYSQMGLKPTKYRSAAEALLRRFRREDDLPRLHPLVDYCNALSLAFAIPVAAFDLDRVAEYIEVRHARGTEQHQAFGGKMEHPSPDEVILCDALDHAHGRRWTFRQSWQSIVTPETKKVLVLCEAMHESAAVDVPVLMDKLAEGISALWSPPKQRGVITAASDRLEF